jgi:hypothetical protein
LAELADDGGVAVVGGVAVERLESWLLALSGRTKTEALRVGKTDQELEQLGVRCKDTATMVEHVERCDLAAIPLDAASLREWLKLIEAHLKPRPSGAQ